MRWYLAMAITLMLGLFVAIAMVDRPEPPMLIDEPDGG